VTAGIATVPLLLTCSECRGRWEGERIAKGRKVLECFPFLPRVISDFVLAGFFQKIIDKNLFCRRI
jgi:hypothetical protein